MESGGASGGGGGGGGDGGGHLCHLCGYKYASAHPSAKQRRAHRKNCGKPPSATAAAGEEEGGDGRKLLLPGEGDGEGGGGGIASAGSGLPGSALDVGNVLQDEGNGDHSSPNGAGAQVSIDKSIEDCLISCNDIPSEVAPKANGTEIQTEVARQLSENALHLEDLHPSQLDVSGDHQQDASASHPPSEPEDGASEISADEISKSCATVLTSNAASDDISAQTNAIVSCPDDTGITEKGCMIDTIGKDKTSEDMLVKDSEINSSYQDKPQTKIVEGQSATTLEEDLCVSNVSVVSQKEIPSEETESKEESGFITTNSVEPSTDKHVHTDDTSGDDLLELAAGGSHLEEGDVVKTQQQTDSTLVVADQLSNSKQTDLEEGQRYPDADEVIQAVSSAIGPDIDAGVISAGSAADLTKKDPTESQIDLVELRSNPTSHVINVLSSNNGVEDAQDNDMSADLTSHERPVEHSVDIEEATSHGANAVCSTGNFEGIKQIEEITAENGLEKISVPQGTISVEEKELIKEVTPDPASVKTDVISSRDIVEEREKGEVYVGTAHEVNMANIPGNVELDKHSEETSKDPTACETNMTSITDNVEENKRKEEIATDPALHAFNVICGPDNEVKKKNEDMTEGPSSHKNALVDGTDNAKEKDEEAMSDPTPYKVDVVSTVDVAEEKKLKEEVVAEPTPHEINVNDVIEKSEEPTVSLKIDAGSNADPILVADTSSHESNTPQVTDNTEEKNQNEDVAADPTSDKIPEAQSTDGVEEKKQKEDAVAVAGEIDTTGSAKDDQNEEITDKEMTINSDKSHVSLKSLLSEKGMEVKEKKASTKDRVLSFRRKSSKDNPSPAKAGSEQHDWNSPARLPAEKSPKGKKQQWMPFICCHSMN